ncbi:MAG: SRPBCC domain-containing protein [Acidobacteriota bacterium]|nr:SRPBCC domain-containing protein [Acidobacteriota bacterium]
MSEAEQQTRSVIVERDFPHPPAKVWRALTESQLLAQWLIKNNFAPEVGRKFQFRLDPMPQWDGVIECEVLVVEPMKQLSYTWCALGLNSVVILTLTETGTGTHLKMEQSGFRSDQQQAYGGAKYGWNNFMNGLERLLDGGDL